MVTKTCLPLQQHPRFGAALRGIGADVDLLDLPGCAPLWQITTYGVRFVTRGPVWHHGTDTARQAASLRQAGIRIINSDHPDTAAMRQAGYRQIMTPACVAELDLRGSADDRLQAASGKWRNIWRKSRRSPLKIAAETFHPGQHRWLLDADRAQQRSKGFRALPQALLTHYPPNAITIFTATVAQEPVAAMLFLDHHPVVTYHIGWANDTGRDHAAHYALLFAAADRYGSRRFARLDLGQVNTEIAPGLARFKIGCGATVRPLGGTWLKIPGF